MWLSVVGKYSILSWRIFRANLASAMSFRLSFLFYVIGAMIFHAGQFLVWIMFFKQFPLIGGWTTNDVILANSLFLFSYSVIDAFAGGITELADMITMGGLDYFLGLPKPVLWHVAVSKSDMTSLGTIVLSLGFFVGFTTVTFSKIVLFLCASCLSVILIFNFFVITQSIAFWVGGFDQAASMARHILRVAITYPFSVFPCPFNYIFMTIIPSFFVVTLPMQLVNDFSITTLITLIGVCILSSIGTFLIFSRGLRRYESGNLMNVRI